MSRTASKEHTIILRAFRVRRVFVDAPSYKVELEAAGKVVSLWWYSALVRRSNGQLYELAELAQGLGILKKVEFSLCSYSW